jgi:curved DNA-binding protein CbpA
MASKTFYDILGVSKEAGPSEIKTAYKNLALKCHPDKNGNTAESTTAFQQLNEAHEILSNHMKRREYDEKLTEQKRQSSDPWANSARDEDGSRGWQEAAKRDRAEGAKRWSDFKEEEKARKSYEREHEPQWLTGARLRYREMLRLQTAMWELNAKILELEVQDIISQNREDEAMLGVETQDSIWDEVSEKLMRERFKRASNRRKQRLQYHRASLRAQEMEHQGLFRERDERRRQRSRDEQDRIFDVEMEELSREEFELQEARW